MTNLSKKLGEMNFDGLFTDVVPAVQVRGGIIRKQTTSAVTLKRGTILAKSYGTAGDGKLVILGSTAANNETLTPDCVLCDDVDGWHRRRRKGCSLHRRLLRPRQGDGRRQLHHHSRPTRTICVCAASSSRTLPLPTKEGVNYECRTELL